MAIREQLDAYVKGRYGIDLEILPFSKDANDTWKSLNGGEINIVIKCSIKLTGQKKV